MKYFQLFGGLVCAAFLEESYRFVAFEMNRLISAAEEEND